MGTHLHWFGFLILASALGCGQSIRRGDGDDDDDDTSQAGSDSGGNGSGGKATVGPGGSNGAGFGGGASGGSETGGGNTGGGSNTGGSSGTANQAGEAGETSFPEPTGSFDPNKLDVLLMIDGSIAMADKQRLFAEAMPLLHQELTSIAGDVHIGVVSSNLGHHGSSDVCSDASSGRTPDDRAELIGSVRDIGTSDFLEWSPETERDFVEDLSLQVESVGELGCGYESSLEAWYRFLVDPEPVAFMDNDGAVAVRGAVNQTVLAQRAAFLRPDSMLAIIMLSDENDCSPVDENAGQGWLVGYKGGPQVNNWRMPAATASCANPNDPCCRPCLLAPSAGCASNEMEGCPPGGSLPIADDSMNLRCFQQVQRFGISLLYPTKRYIEALTEGGIDPRMNGQYVANPLFTLPDGSPTRGRGGVFLSGILGVPWQDVATSESLTDSRALEFLSGEALASEGRWDIILGDPQIGVLPTDPMMIESIDPRPAGTPHPLVAGQVVVPPEGPGGNLINGREQAVDPSMRDDLQFACIFPLPEPVPCNATNAAGCDCNADEYVKNSPLCEYPSPNADGTQINAKAYPSVRQLEVLKGVGAQGTVTSICPRNVTTEDGAAADPDYGYNPAVRAIANVLKNRPRAD
jgi:hypothetical protein